MESLKSSLKSPHLVWFVIGFLCAAGLIMASGAQPTPERPELGIGPYQIEAGSEGGVYIVDTRTGRLWARSTGFYYDLGTPEEPTYKRENMLKP